MDLANLLEVIKNIIWGPPLLAFILGTGIYLTWILRGIQFRYLRYALKQIFTQIKGGAEGDINPFEALMTSLAGAIGTGNIVGVATAIMIGGLGSVFWMTVVAFIGMATKYAESLLAVRYRVLDDRGEMLGGPMQYMERGLGWRFLAVSFALIASIAAIGTGNLVQANAIAESVTSFITVEPIWVGVATAFFLAMVLIGGVRSIGYTTGLLVPVMALFYMAGAIVVIALNYDRIPEAFVLMIQAAFTGQAAAGGFAGATVMMAIQVGVARSVFSNEAGMGISSIASAAAKTDAPGRQAMIAMTGCLASTVLICTLTGLVLAVTEVVGQTNHIGEALTGAAMAFQAFGNTIYGGEYIVSIGLILFAFSTIIAWAYYGEKCFEYIFGAQSVLYYRIFFVVMVIPGAVLKITTVWLVADILNGLMAIPNLIALLALSGVIASETKSFLEIVRREQLSTKNNSSKEIISK